MKRLIMSVITLINMTYPISMTAGLCDLIKACIPACCTCGDSELDHILVEASLCKKDAHSKVLSHDYENYCRTETGFGKRKKTRDEIEDHTQEAAKEKRITIDHVDIDQNLKRAAIRYTVRIRTSEDPTVKVIDKIIDIDQTPVFDYDANTVVKLSATRIYRSTRHARSNHAHYELEEVQTLQDLE